jgi:DNA-binding NarL/FixJ family response regulator
MECGLCRSVLTSSHNPNAAGCAGGTVLVLMTYSGDIQAMRALEAGAAGYLVKGSMRKELVQAILTCILLNSPRIVRVLR